MYTLRAQHEIKIRATCAHVFGVLTRYENYPQLFEQVVEIRVLSRHDGVSRVEFELDLGARLQYTLRLVEDAPSVLRWSLADANLLQQMSGSWTLEVDAETACLAHYQLEVKLAGQIPMRVQTRLVEQILPAMLERVRAQAEKTSDAEPSLSV